MIPYVLVVEDDKDIQEYLKALLTENGYAVKTASTGVSALNLINKSEPDLIVLDLRLPDISGESVCTQIRKDYPSLPIIILTAKDSVSDKIRGLGLGADDYITKPFIAEELLARVKTRLRVKSGERGKMRIADLELDPQKVQVKRGSKNINLTPQEFKLLEYLMNNKGIVLTRDMILNRIWLYSPNVESRVVDVYMGYLRKKIDYGFPKKLLYSIRGFGYTIKE
jgi:two-component system, OmpR family, response regulator ArlR